MRNCPLQLAYILDAQNLQGSILGLGSRVVSAARSIGRQ